jgi:hypothetical protein
MNSSDLGPVDKGPQTSIRVDRSRYRADERIMIEVRHYRFPLNRMYDMTLDGTYSVFVNRLISGRARYDSDGRMPAIKKAKSDELVSNELVVVVSDLAGPK